MTTKKSEARRKRDAVIEEVLRRREEGGFSYFVVGANAADALAPVVAELAGH